MTKRLPRYAGHRAALLCAAISCNYLQARAHADAPPLRYSIDAAAGIVKDTRTGLTWQREVGEAKHTWAAAKDYCANLSLAGGGFRIPTVKELLTLVEPTLARPAIDRSAFPNTPAEPFWTATPGRRTAGTAWYVEFVSGGAQNPGVNESYRVRCVR